MQGHSQGISRPHFWRRENLAVVLTHLFVPALTLPSRQSWPALCESVVRYSDFCLRRIVAASLVVLLLRDWFIVSGHHKCERQDALSARHYCIVFAPLPQAVVVHAFLGTGTVLRWRSDTAVTPPKKLLCVRLGSGGAGALLHSCATRRHSSLGSLATTRGSQYRIAGDTVCSVLPVSLEGKTHRPAVGAEVLPESSKANCMVRAGVEKSAATMAERRWNQEKGVVRGSHCEGSQVASTNEKGAHCRPGQFECATSWRENSLGRGGKHRIHSVSYLYSYFMLL